MRPLYIYLILFIAGSGIFLPAGAYGQVRSQSFLCDSVSPNASGQLIVAAYMHRDCISQVDDIDSAKKIVQMLKLEVMKYFDLGATYDTEQKQNDFKNSKEYKNDLAELTSMRDDALKGYYFSVLTTSLGKFRWDVKGFKFDMDKLSTPGGVIGAPPPPKTMFYDIDLRKLPFNISGQDQEMVISLDPEKGLNIERNKDSVMTIVLYKLGEVAAKEYSYYSAQCKCNRNAKEDVVLTNTNRVIIFNMNSGEIYYDEKY